MWVALVRHCRGPLISRVERLLHLPNLRPLQMANLGRHFFQGPADACDDGQQECMAIALNDLSRSRSDAQAQRAADLLLQLGWNVRVCPDRARDFSDSNVLARE